MFATAFLSIARRASEQICTEIFKWLYDIRSMLMCFIEQIKCYDELIAHKSKFDAQNKEEAEIEKLLASSKTGQFYSLYLRNPYSVIRAQGS